MLHFPRVPRIELVPRLYLFFLLFLSLLILCLLVISLLSRSPQMEISAGVQTWTWRMTGRNVTSGDRRSEVMGNGAKKRGVKAAGVVTRHGLKNTTTRNGIKPVEKVFSGGAELEGSAGSAIIEDACDASSFTLCATEEVKVCDDKDEDVGASEYVEASVNVGRVYVWRAYLDRRQPGPHVYVRVLTMLHSTPAVALRKVHAVWCYVWYNKHLPPNITTASSTWMWRKSWFGNTMRSALHLHIYHPFLYSCQIPATKTPPLAVSVSGEKCSQPMNAIRVIDVPETRMKEVERNSKSENEKGAKTNKTVQFAVCLKGLNYMDRDISDELVEWLELHFLLGVGRVFIYHYNTENNTKEVLDFYTRAGTVEVTQQWLPGELPNTPAQAQHDYIRRHKSQKRFVEVLAYMDCLYRSVGTYEFVILVDLDEVIVPLRHRSYHGLIAEVQRSMGNHFQRAAAFPVRNCYFMDEMRNGERVHAFPSNLRFLQNTKRSDSCSPFSDHAKSFHRTSAVLVIHNHMPLKVLPGYQRLSRVSESLAHLHHYKAVECENHTGAVGGPCQQRYRDEVREDRTMWRFSKDLVNRTQTVIKQIFNKN